MKKKYKINSLNQEKYKGFIIDKDVRFKTKTPRFVIYKNNEYYPPLQTSRSAARKRIVYLKKVKRL